MGTDAWGIDDGYWNVAGDWVPTPRAAIRRIRTAMGARTDEDFPPPTRPVWFVPAGTAPPIDIPARLELEDGSELSAEGRLPPDLPLGYHHLHPSDGGPTTMLIVVPTHAHPFGERRRWGWAVQLHTTRSARSWGIGDLGDLAQLGAATSADVLAISPIGADLPLPRQQPSPYFASSRRWLNPLFLRIEDVPGAAALDADLRGPAISARALLDDPLIDRDEANRLKRRALDVIWQRFRDSGGDADFDAFLADEGAPLARFALHEALVEEFGTTWNHWPGDFRHPDGARVSHFVRTHAERIRFHSWLQWLLDRQLAAAAEACPLIGDLPVGFDPAGADAWCDQDLLAEGISVGAPPDEFNQAGQDWGVPPYVPWRLRDAGYHPFAYTVRRALRHLAGLRIDHVMGLFRLFWIPRDLEPTDGAYVRAFGDELLDIVALESVRAGAYILGEDLGTVEPEVREAMTARGMLGYRVGWFEDREPRGWPSDTVGMLTTHDLPTLAGVWSGADLEDQRAAGLPGDEGGLSLMRARLFSLADDPSLDSEPAAVALAAHLALGTAGSALVLPTLEDAVGSPHRPNIPGTVERANWRIALPVPVEDLAEHPGVRMLAEAVAAGRAEPDPTEQSVRAHEVG